MSLLTKFSLANKWALNSCPLLNLFRICTPKWQVEYELIKVMESSYMFESDGAYGHVNFIAKAKNDGFKEQLFFAELCLQGETDFLTCFCCLKDEEHQTG